MSSLNRTLRGAPEPASPRHDPLPDPHGLLETAGATAAFAWRLGRELPQVRRYAAEALRQAAIVVTGSTLVILAIAFFAGGSCGLESSSLAEAFGAAPLSGGFSAWCTLREVVPFVFGYIVAAKVGCGMVAELAAMRAAEEVDALEAMGIRSLAYLAGTRLIGCALVLPFVYLLAIAASYAAAELESVGRYADVSVGTWRLFFLTFQDGSDLLYSLCKGLAISAFVVVVALHQGYGLRARGPVDVGVATARSMAINIVGVTLISMAGTLIVWGANPRIPLG
jgi:phospholipid/cholesterol/gamma-HCH transport system permease protein